MEPKQARLFFCQNFQVLSIEFSSFVAKNVDQSPYSKYLRWGEHCYRTPNLTLPIFEPKFFYFNLTRPKLMIQVETFPNAPITEALIDLRAELSDIDLETLKAYQYGIQDQFPNRQERTLWTGGIELKEQGKPQINHSSGRVDGYLFKSEKEQKIVQARLDGFTFNKLKPYENWDIFSEEAKSLWEKYVFLVKPKRVTRIALRYINRINVPIMENELSIETYFKTYPEFSKTIDCKLSNFFMRLLLREPAIKAQAVVHQTIEEVKDNICPFIFDIDVSIVSDFDPSDKNLWSTMSALRDFKNKIFFESLTNKTKELFR